jgi:dipeptidyl aminopeptidase/acylaminoacyl peptidase
VVRAAEPSVEDIEIERYYANLNLQLRLFGAEELGRRYVVVRLARYAANAHLDYGDITRVLAPIKDFGSWYPAWRQAGVESEELATAEETRGHLVSAADHFLRASMLYHFGQLLARLGTEGKAEGRRRRVELYHRAIDYLDRPIEPITIPYDGQTLPGYLHLPRGVERPGCVIMIDGADSVKEEYHNWAGQFARRGLAVVTFDGPGQGETLGRLTMDPNRYGLAVSAVIDLLEQDGRVDTSKVVVWGSSMGGYLVGVAAAQEPRLKAAVSLGGFFDFRDYAYTWPLGTQINVQEDIGAPTLAAARAYVREHLSLSQFAPRITCPFLVIHGALDDLVTTEEAARMADESPRGELVVFENGFHTCTNENYRLVPLMTGWVLDRLREAS